MRSLARCLSLGTLLTLLAWNQLTADDAKIKAAPMGEIKLPPPSEIQSLTAQPPALKLIGSDDASQIVVSGTMAGGKLQDLSGDVKYEVADTKIVRVTTSGHVYALTNGQTTITARYGD